MMNVEHATNAARVTAGMDWAKDDHAVYVAEPGGEVMDRFSVGHDLAGLRVMITRLLKAGVEQVGIERPDGPVVEALLQAAVVVFVIPFGQRKNRRSCYGSASNKDAPFDAYVLADTVSTGVRRLRALVCDSTATTALRSLTRARKDLVGRRVAVANQLRAHMQIVFPAATTICVAIGFDINLRFLEHFTTADQTAWRTAGNSSDPKRLAAWLRSVG
ncbi:IS110 family transposase [Streptomyces sp. NPDC002076]